MKVKIGNKIYNSKNEPVMIVLSEGEKKQIANMTPFATRYCLYPKISKWTKDNYREINEWVSDIKNEDTVS